MRKSPLNKIGKIGRRNLNANKILKFIYTDRGITRCEICGDDFMLSWHHRHKREWYRKYPRLLCQFNQTLLLDIKCHNMLELDGNKHKKYFHELRGKEVLPLQ